MLDPEPSDVPHLQDPPVNGVVEEYPSHIEWMFDSHVVPALVSHLQEVPESQMGFTSEQPLWGIVLVRPHVVLQVPSELQYPVPHVPGVDPSPLPPPVLVHLFNKNSSGQINSNILYQKLYLIHYIQN